MTFVAVSNPHKPPINSLRSTGTRHEKARFTSNRNSAPTRRVFFQKNINIECSNWQSVGLPRRVTARDYVRALIYNQPTAATRSLAAAAEPLIANITREPPQPRPHHRLLLFIIVRLCSSRYCRSVASVLVQVRFNIKKLIQCKIHCWTSQHICTYYAN